MCGYAGASKFVVWGCVALLGGWLLPGCESQPAAAPHTQPNPPPAAARSPHAGAPPAPVTPAPSPAAPVAAQPPEQPPATADKEVTKPAEPELPKYLAIVARYDASATAEVKIVEAEGRRLTLATQNVKRLRIDRVESPLVRGRSINLRLDEQPLEWLANSPVTEFERSANGVWAPVKP